MSFREMERHGDRETKSLLKGPGMESGLGGRTKWEPENFDVG